MARAGLAPFGLLFSFAVAACGGGDPGRAVDGGEIDAEPGPACSAITDRTECRSTPGCVADDCILCTCTPELQGCRREGEPPAMCPDVDCPEPFCCGTEADCVDTGFPCAPPDAPPGCGFCNPDPGDCASDDDCSPGTTGNICEPIPCSCDGATHCVAGCTDSSSCAEGSACDPTAHRCLPIACPSGDECPPNFSCVAPGPTAHHCERTACAGDADCPEGWCVLSRCFDSLGQCTPPVP